MLYWFCYMLATLLDGIYFRCSYPGRENLPKKGAFILACNHISNLDPFIVGICDRRKFSFVAKDSLFKKKILSFIFTQWGAIPIKRDSSDFYALRETIKRLKDGRPVVLFPEGTRGIGSRKKKPQAGIGLIATKAQVPVFPVFIKDSDKAFPNGAKWFKRHDVTVKIGQEIKIEKGQSYEEISAQIADRIYALEN